MKAAVALRRNDQEVFELSRESLDELPYGVITLDRQGTVLRYNQAEADFARRATVTTVGLNFFAEVAPCTNVQAFKGRFDTFAAQHDSGVDRFDFSFAFRWGRHDVSITLLRKIDHEEINVLVRGRSLATIGPPTALSSVPRIAAVAAAQVPHDDAATQGGARELGEPAAWRVDAPEERAWRRRIHRDDIGTVQRLVALARAQHRAYSIEYRASDASGRPRVFLEQGNVAGDTGGATAIDITEQRAREDELWRVAHYDALTGLATRRLLLRRISDAAVEATVTGRIAAVLFVDLDRFKAVNDTFGHAVGDQLLRTFALRLGECVRGGDTVARLNGDEFVVLLTDLDDVPMVEKTVRRLLTTISQPIEISGRVHYVTASIGVSVAPYHGSDATMLLQAADSAMYGAKSGDRNSFQWYTPEMSAAIADNHRTEDDLRAALQRDELEVFYQPIVGAADRRIVAVEALVRWNHPVRGLVMPNSFIPIAERSGLIGALGEVVLRDACRHIAAWDAAGHAIRVCVNVSTAQLRQAGFVDVVREMLRETGATPQRLELEVTESMMIEGFDETMDTLTKLKLLGVRLAIDDFGTGYSSLSYLKYLPVDTLKIDRSFIIDIAVDKFDRAIASAVLVLARELRLECIAEGIETREQYELLRDLGCPMMQGYYFARPGPVTALDLTGPALGA